MGSDVLLRPGRPDDAPALLEILDAALAAERSAGGIAHAFPDPAREIAWLEYLMRDPDGSACVAEADGRPVAFGITARRGGVLWLAFLFVAPQEQGRGLGRRVLAQLWPAGCGPRATLVDGSSRVAMAMYLSHGLIPLTSVLAFEGAPPAGGAGSTSILAVDDQDADQTRLDVLDEQVFGASRRRDHEHWTSQGFALRQLRRASGEWLGYARWSPAGRLGPVTLQDREAWPQALEVILRAMQAAGVVSVRMMIPAENNPALHWALEQGYVYTGMEVALATRPIGDWSRCLIHRAALP
jgi:GNAT superfamily N-acetyltransferase